MAEEQMNKLSKRGQKLSRGQWIGYVLVSLVLLGLLVFGLYGVQQFQQGRFAWMAQDETRILNKVKRVLSPASVPVQEDAVMQRMVPLHDDAKSRYSEFTSDLEQDCYLAFAGSICGFSREASQAQRRVGYFVNAQDTQNEQVQVCARGTQRFQSEMDTLRTGRPHCNTVRDIVQRLKDKTS